MRIDGRLTGLCWALVLLFAACANDTGRPRVTSDDRLPFEDDPSNFPVITPPSLTPPPVGSSGMGSMGTSPPMGKPARPTSCTDAKSNAVGIVSDECVECACDLNLVATVACTADCWRLMVCVARNCEATDTTCIIQHCNPSGDLTALSMAGNLARAVPINACAPKCFFDNEISEAGIENDF